AASQPVNDSSLINPFAAVTVTNDDAPSDTIKVEVRMSTISRGSFTPTSLTGWTPIGTNTGKFEFTGTAAQCQAALRALVFDPLDNCAPVGQTWGFSFAVVVRDGSAVILDPTTSLVVTSANDKPSATGIVSNQPVKDNATIRPFLGVTITDPDPGQMLTVEVRQSALSNGGVTPASPNGWASLGRGKVSLAGNPASLQKALPNLAIRRA